MPILIRAVELWTHDPAVTTPILKLFAELLHCRTQRLQGNVSSPMGILLFREASKLICIYGNRILHMDVPRDKQYPMRLKGISICFTILKNALGGNYVNFGVFKLYGDDTLDNVLNIAAKMITSIQQNDLLVRETPTSCAILLHYIDYSLFSKNMFMTVACCRNIRSCHRRTIIC